MVEELSRAAAHALQQVGPAVVSIGRDGRGSGVVIGPGKVLTNAHNLRDRTTTVTFSDGRTEAASLGGADPDGDLAVLDVDTGGVEPAPLTHAEVSEGAVVFALGRGGGRLRVSMGLVSAVDQAFTGPRGREVAGGIEHSAPLARGASGGPVVNGAGQVVAINTHRIGGGFYLARPTDGPLLDTVDKLKAGASIERPRLGVALAPSEVAAKLRASVGLPPRAGLLVRAVEDESPAAAAGIETGDLLVAAGDRVLDTIGALNDVLAPATTSLALTVVRGIDERTIEVRFE